MLLLQSKPQVGGRCGRGAPTSSGSSPGAGKAPQESPQAEACTHIYNSRRSQDPGTFVQLLSPSNTTFCLVIILSASNASPSSCKANCHEYPRPLPKTLFCKTFSDVPTGAPPGGFCSALLGCLANLLIITYPQLALRAREVTCCHSMKCMGGRHRLFVSDCSHST